tara:strand:- start:24456 stop:25040 length:585 start_codon:yes stop_codon:yes gene_type:complete
VEVATTIAQTFPREIAGLFPGEAKNRAIGLDHRDEEDSRGYRCESIGPQFTEIWSGDIWLLGASETPVWARPGWTVWESAEYCKGISWQHRKLWQDGRLLYLETQLDDSDRKVQFNNTTSPLQGQELAGYVESTLCYLSRTLGTPGVVLEGYDQPRSLPLPEVLEPRSARFAISGCPEAESESKYEAADEDISF